MTHAEFVTAFRSGSIRVNVDPKDAGRFVSARMLLPFVMLPVLGTGVALALTGWLWTGFAVIGIGTVAPIMIKRAAPNFIVTHALQDVEFYEEVTGRGLLQISQEP